MSKVDFFSDLKSGEIAPDYTNENTIIYNNDCMKILQQIPDSSIDLLTTDPPYRLSNGGGGVSKDGKKYCSGILGHAIGTDTKNARNGKLFDYNDIKFSQWLPEVYRILKPQTHAYIFTNARNLKELWQCAENVGFKFQQLIVWDKGNITPTQYYLNSYELILMLRKGNAKYINNLGTKNILRIPNTKNKSHPCAKPTELLKILIENSSNENDIVLDPFVGSGATGVACLETNRKFIRY